MECILAADESNLCSLERLELRYLDKLRRICRVIAPPSALASLEDLQVNDCNSLKSTLFPLELMKNPRNLEESDVE
ncbi:hypothetical protein NC651_040458 [Populus alba x Populus x berolinensis]|nr:hypothetical protein NC651_040458 [Populus alba x Populus x berolinensis]